MTAQFQSPDRRPGNRVDRSDRESDRRVPARVSVGDARRAPRPSATRRTWPRAGSRRAAYRHGLSPHPLLRGSREAPGSSRPARPQLTFCGSMTDNVRPGRPGRARPRGPRRSCAAPRTTRTRPSPRRAPRLVRYADRMPPNLWVGDSPPDWFMESGFTGRSSGHAPQEPGRPRRDQAADRERRVGEHRTALLGFWPRSSAPTTRSTGP